jgi:hypothetical protein
MTPLGPGEIQARKRPLAVLAVAGLRLLLGLCLAYPLASIVADSGVGLGPEGDRVLFEGGAYLLLDVLRLKGADLLAAARGLGLLFALGLVLTAASSGALLLVLNLRGRLRLRDWLPRLFERLPALLALGAGTCVAQGVVLGIAAAVLDSIPAPMARPVATSLLELGVCLLAAALAGAFGGLSDVAKAALVRHQASLGQAVRQAVDCLRRHPARACFGWLPFSLAFAAAVALCAVLTAQLDVSRAGAWRVAGVFALHQLVVVSSIALRAAWLARALRLSATSAPLAIRGP